MRLVRDIIASFSRAELEELSQHVMDLLVYGSSLSAQDGNRIITCPACGSVRYVRNGHVAGRQRFMCKDCRKTFGHSTNTAIFSTKLPREIWEHYVSCVVNGFSIRRAAEVTGIGIKAAFYMRHKVLDALRQLMDRNRVSGVIEMDETFFRESFKGNHRKSGFTLPRPARKRGGESSMRGLSREQICVGTAIDRQNNVIMGILCRGRVTTDSLNGLYTGRVEEASTICTDSASAYRGYSERHMLAHRRIPSGRYSDGEFTLSRVNSLHSNLKTWMRRFNGVSTKHLANYLAWYSWLAMNRDARYNALPRRMMSDTLSETVDARIIRIRRRAVVFAA